MEDNHAIKVIAIEENEDGSANVELEMNHDAKSLLIEIGFIELLERHIEGLGTTDGTTTL